MVQELNRSIDPSFSADPSPPSAPERPSAEFPAHAPTAYPVFYRTYSRRGPQGRESWPEVCDRTTKDLADLGQLTAEEAALVDRMQRELKSLTSGRWLWVGGTDWIHQPENFSGAYNCTSTNVTDWRAFGLMMDLAMMGCGTGAVLEPEYVNQLPPIRNHLTIELCRNLGTVAEADRQEQTDVVITGDRVQVTVGDSRQGWVASYQALLDVCSDEQFSGAVTVAIDLSNVRPAGETLRGFGGVANPIKLPELYDRVAKILNRAIGRQLTSVECCLLVDEAALTIVAGNIRRCLPGEALVHTEAGLVPIEKVRVGDRVLTSKGYYPVTNFFRQGKQSLCRIQTQDGSFECTPDHKVAVLSNVYGQYTMVKAKDLNPGDRLIFVPQAIRGTPTELPEFRGQVKGKTKPITVPALTPDFAYFLGYLHGDGSVASDGSRVRFRIHEDSPQIIDKLVEVGRQFGLTTYTLRSPQQCKTKAYELQFNSSAFNQYLRQFKQAFQPLHIPDYILLGTPDLRQAYLAGLADADGCHSQGVLVASVHQRFLQEVQALYASLGITVRLCSSIRKRTGKWEGELVTVGEQAFNAIEAAFESYSLQFSNQKRPRPQSFKDHGFPVAMVRPIINTYQYPWSSSQSQMIVPTLKRHLPQATDLIPVAVVGVALDVRSAETFDIEVANIHEFVCEGILVSNSAGMRQFDSNDELGAKAKDNLWQQDKNGNWRIDPDRDSLRMANHSRVFHHKPTEAECIEAVRKQFYSGEGAIQWAGEAIARANADLVTPDQKRSFIQAYEQQKGAEWLRQKDPNLDHRELSHRLSRYGLNPCHSADTLVSTDRGLIPIAELVDQNFQALVDLRSVSLDGVRLTKAIAFPTGVQTTYQVTLSNGLRMRCTADHEHFTNDGWVATKNLTPQHKIFIQKGQGQFGQGTISPEQAQMLGWLYGDGSIDPGSRNSLEAVFYINQKEYSRTFPVLASAVQSLTGYQHQPSVVKGMYTFHSGSAKMSQFLAGLGVVSKAFLPTNFLTQSKEVVIGFLQGLFCADGAVSLKARHIDLISRSHELLAQVQLLLLNLGIRSSLRQKTRPGADGVRYKLKDGTEKISNNRGAWRLLIDRGEAKTFANLIGFPLSEEKQQKLQQLIQWQPSRTYAKPIQNLRFSSAVESVREYGEEPVYDLHVPLTHSFVANGCLTHNCGEILGADFHCVAGETMLVTRSGMASIRSLAGQSVEIWNGQRWSRVTPLLTGKNRQLYRVAFADGTSLDVTSQHRFFVKNRFGKNYQEMTTQDLQAALVDQNYALHTEPFEIDYQDGKFVDPIWAYTLGQLVGDGSVCGSQDKPQLQLRLYGAKSYRELEIAGHTSGELRYYAENLNTPCLLYNGFHKQFDPIHVRDLKAKADPLEALAGWNREGILHFVAGLIDADGSATQTGGVRLYLSGYDRTYRIYLLLLKCGIRSSINLMARAGQATNLGVRQKDLWYLQITDCAAIPCQRVDTSGGHKPTAKGKWQVIRSITPLEGWHDTFCFNEPEFHKGVFGGTLTGQCNLSEIHLNQIDPKDLNTQEEAFKAGALSVAGLLNHHFQEERYAYSRSVDPIVGVSFTGLFDFFVQAFGVDWLRWWEAGRPETAEGLAFKAQEQTYLNRWREIVHETIWNYCDRQGLRRPNRCTTVQPAGCLDRTAVRIFDQGLLYADEIINPGSGETMGLDLSVRGGIATDTAIANQPLNLVRVTLANGRVLRMTPNHRLSIAGQWVRADQIQIGMEIDHSLGEYCKSEDALLLPLNLLDYGREERKQSVGHGRGVLTRTISTPTTLNPDLGYFLGCLYGDGAMSEHKHRIRFAFNAKEYDLVERLQAIAERWFGLTGTVDFDPRNDGSRGELVFAAKQLFDWLHLNGLDKPASVDLDRIPQAIRRSSRETILSFFCGLIDTDGCVRERGSLSIDSASEAFIRNLQQIGEAVGLSFSIFHNSQGSNLQTTKTMWGLCLSRMMSQPTALTYVNRHSRKCGLRPLPSPKRQFAFHPYQVAAIEFETLPDYSYDFAVSGIDDDDSWYWQGGLKSHNTKSLLTGASPGWHPPKAARFIRRITFRKNDPVAMACFDYGYKIVPSQADKDENGNLLDDPFDPRCTEWLVEIPVAVSWADLPGADTIAIEKFSALAQFDFYMQVQRHYTRHNTSATIELREDEIELLGQRIYGAIANDEGYMSAALLSRFDAPFPRLPFEKIDEPTYDRLVAEMLARRKTDVFHEALKRYDLGEMLEAGPAGCDSDKCLLPEP